MFYRAATMSTIVGLVAVLILGCQVQKTKTPLTVGLATYPGFAPGFVAKEKGFFGDLPVNFVVVDDFTARQNAFTSGKTQLTVSTLDSYAFESGHGVGGRIVMILDQSNGADGIIVDSTVSSVSDLKGKSVAFTRGSPSHYFLIAILRQHGLSLQDIKRIEVDDPGRASEAFFSGSVQAAVTWEPNISQITSAGKGRVLESSKTFPGLIVDIMVASPVSIVERRNDISQFVSGWLKAVDYVKDHPDETYSIMARELKLPLEDFKLMVKGLLFADKETNRNFLLGGAKSKGGGIFDDATQVWINEGLIQKPQKSDTIIVTDFIK